MSSAEPLSREESQGLAAALREKWTAVALSTGPSDRAAAQEAARELYLRAGLTPPEGYVWLDSPLEGIVAATVFQDRDPEGLFRRFDVPRPRRIFECLNAPRREGAPEPPAAFDALRRLCSRAIRIVRDRLAESFSARYVYDIWHAGIVGVEPGSEGFTPEQLKSEVFARVREKLLRQTPPAVKPRRWQRVLEPFETNGAAVRLTREIPFETMPGGDTRDFGFGTHDAWRLAFCEWALAAGGGGDEEEAERLTALCELSRQCGWWWPLSRLVVFTERPTAVGCEASGRLHAPDGPALGYKDGWSFYAWRGMEVTADLIENRHLLTVGQIEDEHNVEWRRAMIEIYGPERFLLDSRARVVHQDEFGILYSLELFRDEPLVMVEVRNSTPEPDGSHKTYFLRVPPNVRTAREAVAWTFGLEASDYGPSVQT
ncbi:MAG: hypothetical protein JOZ96_28360 [Acidobacteria bacterium]|nr:hypothetical protein [Acidobacteriota bacterium]